MRQISSFELLSTKLEKRLSRLPAMQALKKIKPETAASSSTLWHRQGETRKVNNCFALLKRITRLKNVYSEIGSQARVSYLERYSPNGSCHLDESSMNHTLAQNYHCEFWFGMHLTCKNTSIMPDRNGSVKRPEKVARSYHRHSQS